MTEEATAISLKVNAGTSGVDVHTVAVLLRNETGHRVSMIMHRGDKDSAVGVALETVKKDCPTDEPVYWLRSTVRVKPNFVERVMLVATGSYAICDLIIKLLP